jgi:hypothetical protein
MLVFGFLLLFVSFLPILSAYTILSKPLYHSLFYLTTFIPHLLFQLCIKKILHVFQAYTYKRCHQMVVIIKYSKITIFTLKVLPHLEIFLLYKLLLFILLYLLTREETNYYTDSLRIQ